MSKFVHERANGYSHRGSMYLGIIGFTNRHLSPAERATIRGWPHSAVSPSSVGRGVYSVDDAMKGTASSSSSSCLEIDDGCGRRKKYVIGITSGRTYVTMGFEKYNNRPEGLSPTIILHLLAHQGFGAPTKGMHQRAQQHRFQMRNIWIRRNRSGPAHRKFRSNTYPTLRPAAAGR